MRVAWRWFGSSRSKSASSRTAWRTSAAVSVRSVLFSSGTCSLHVCEPGGLLRVHGELGFPDVLCILTDEFREAERPVPAVVAPPMGLADDAAGVPQIDGLLDLG